MLSPIHVQRLRYLHKHGMTILYEPDRCGVFGRIVTIEKHHVLVKWPDGQAEIQLEDLEPAELYYAGAFFPKEHRAREGWSQ